MKQLSARAMESRRAHKQRLSHGQTGIVDDALHRPAEVTSTSRSDIDWVEERKNSATRIPRNPPPTLTNPKQNTLRQPGALLAYPRRKQASRANLPPPAAFLLTSLYNNLDCRPSLSYATPLPLSYVLGVLLRAIDYDLALLFFDSPIFLASLILSTLSQTPRLTCERARLRNPVPQTSISVGECGSRHC